MLLYKNGKWEDIPDRHVAKKVLDQHSIDFIKSWCRESTLYERFTMIDSFKSGDKECAKKIKDALESGRICDHVAGDLRSFLDTFIAYENKFSAREKLEVATLEILMADRLACLYIINNSINWSEKDKEDKKETACC